MPIKKSAKKELRKTRKRTSLNVNRKREIKELIKDIRKALKSQNIDGAKKLVNKVEPLIDKAAKRKTIHKNTAARKKSRIFNAIKKAKNK